MRLAPCVTCIAALALCLTACGSDPTPSPAPSDASVAPDTLATDTNPCATVEGLSCACGASLGTWRCAGVMPVCVCMTPDVQPADDRETAPDTRVVCDAGVYCPATGGCVNTLISAAHCGACGNRCASGRVCVDGSCVTPVVDAGAPRDAAADVGCDADTLSDPRHCGGCGVTCSVPSGVTGVVPRCVSGTCRVACMTGVWDCNGNAADGCEADDTYRRLCSTCRCREVLP